MSLASFTPPDFYSLKSKTFFEREMHLRYFLERCLRREIGLFSNLSYLWVKKHFDGLKMDPKRHKLKYGHSVGKMSKNVSFSIFQLFKGFYKYFFNLFHFATIQYTIFFTFQMCETILKGFSKTVSRLKFLKNLRIVISKT